MKSDPISTNLISHLTDKCGGFAFEDLLKSLLAITYEGFVPAGGVKDGGSDGELHGVFSEPQDGRNFIQISKEGNANAKIKKTVDRLIEYGRDVAALTYWTQRVIPNRDVLEDQLSGDLNVVIRIREFSSLVQLINRDEKTSSQFRRFFADDIRELIELNEPSDEDPIHFVDDPTVYAFLSLENSERSSKGGLVVPVVDALLYWSLRETDPESENLLIRPEIKNRIRGVLPGAENVLIPHVDERLTYLSTKGQSGAERIRWYKEQDAFCLPFAMREKIASNSAGDKLIISSVEKSLANRIAASKVPEAEAGRLAKITLQVIYEHFHEQGMALAAFLESKLESLGNQEQAIEGKLQAACEVEVVTPQGYSAALSALRSFFYEPSTPEIEFQRSVSRTSMLLVSLKYSPQLVEYFNGMTAKFRLIVGSDILIKAVSEWFLSETSRTVINILLAIQEAGAELILTQPVVEEVFTHLRATNLEFKNHYANREQFFTRELGSESDRILIRAYFHAKFSNKVRSWRAYIENFIDFHALDSRTEGSVSQMQAYLEKTFKMKYVDSGELAHGVDDADLRSLAEKLMARDPQKREELARNDALLALSVYARRRRHREERKYDGFGLQTWWLTKETRILSYTADLVRQRSAPYIMRPEFLLNFLSLSPNAKLSRRSRDLLPAHVGIQLGQHLSDRHMQTLLSAVEEWGSLPPERVQIKISGFADKLKFDRLKQYKVNLGGSDVDEVEKSIRALSDEMRPVTLKEGARIV